MSVSFAMFKTSTDAELTIAFQWTDHVLFVESVKDPLWHKIIFNPHHLASRPQMMLTKTRGIKSLA